MSSSEALSPRRFALGLALAGGLIVATYAGAVLALDPMAGGAGYRGCPSGLKTRIITDAKSIVARRMAPRTIILGTSRVDNGFGAGALAELGPAPRTNLATADALPAEMAALARDALAGGRLERAYIGVDFNSALSSRNPGAARAIADAPLPALEAARRTWFGPAVFEALGEWPPDCTITLNPDGTATPARLARLPHPGASAAHVAKVRAAYSARAQQRQLDGGRLAAGRLEELRTMVRQLRLAGVTVVIFSAPQHSKLTAIQQQAGLGSASAAWQHALADLARSEGAAFADLRSPAMLARAGLAACPRNTGADCHFRDLTHYSRAVGQAMAAPLAEAAQNPGMPQKAGARGLARKENPAYGGAQPGS